MTAAARATEPFCYTDNNIECDKEDIDNNQTYTMIPLNLFALCNLPLAGQRALAAENNMYIRTAIARAGTTHIDIINMLTDDREELVRAAAMLRTTNKTRLVTAQHETFTSEANAAANPNAPIDFLVAMLNSTTNPAAVLEAYSNPTTPLEARQRLTTTKVHEMLKPDVGNRLLAYKQVQAFELVLNNPWMTETPDRWDDLTRQAINCLKEGAARHIQALEDPQFTLQDALKMLKTNPRLGPSISGRLVNQHGLGQLYAGMVTPLTEVEFMSIAWVAPIVYSESASRMYKTRYREAIQACEILGDNEPAWQTFAGLAPNWYGSCGEAVEAAFRL